MLAISSVLGNRQSLDGGAMFGNVPRALWQRWCTPDAVGRIELACRCVLVECDGRKILIETGVGAFFEPKLAERFGVTETHHQLLVSLAELQTAPEDIDVVLLSHLHFDHAGGLLSAFEPGKPARLVFPNARFLVGEQAYARACSPHPRDRASFIPELVSLLTTSGRLLVIPEGAERHPLLTDRVSIAVSHGHTPGMLIPSLWGQVHTATFCADLVPGVPWVHLPVTMGYDRHAELLIDEKTALFERLGAGSWLLFTHDQRVAAGKLARETAFKFSVQETQSAFTRWDLDKEGLARSSGDV